MEKKQETKSNAESTETLRVDLTWTEKYLTFEQSSDGTLRPTDCHFLAEVCYRDPDRLRDLSASLSSGQSGSLLATYDRDDPRAFTNGFYYTRKSKSYDGFDELEAAHPAHASYVWQLQGPRGHLRLAPVRIGGPAGRTAVPEPSPIFLLQLGKPVRDLSRVLPDEPLTISWRPFSNAMSRAGAWQDFIFVLVSDDRGEVVFTGGFVEHTKVSCVVPAGTLTGGTGYVAFISQVKIVDHNISYGIDQLAANSFAVELPISTAGAARPLVDAVRRAPYLWKEKTPREKGLVPWPGFVTKAAS